MVRRDPVIDEIWIPPKRSQGFVQGWRWDAYNALRDTMAIWTIMQRNVRCALWRFRSEKLFILWIGYWRRTAATQSTPTDRSGKNLAICLNAENCYKCFRESLITPSTAAASRNLVALEPRRRAELAMNCTPRSISGSSKRFAVVAMKKTTRINRASTFIYYYSKIRCAPLTAESGST